MKAPTTATARRTLFDTPVVSAMLGHVARVLLVTFGWRKVGELPSEPKYVMIAAPHTSNWDLPVMLTLAFAFGARIFWMGKHTLFRGPFGILFRWLGGVPVDRRRSGNVVNQVVEIFQRRESFALILAPEGTRNRTAYWKTGFYHMANGAGVPIVLGFLDYRRKEGGMGPTVRPTGDIGADMKMIREFYSGVSGKRSAQTGLAEVAAKPSHPLP